MSQPKWAKGPNSNANVLPTELLIAPANLVVSQSPNDTRTVNILPAVPGITYRLFRFSISVITMLGATAVPVADVFAGLQSTQGEVLARIQGGAFDSQAVPPRSLDQDFQGYTLATGVGVNLVLLTDNGIVADSIAYGSLDFLLYSTNA